MLVSNSDRKTNFTSTPVKYVNIKTKKGTLEKVVYSLLNPKDPEDFAAVQKIAETWKVEHYLGKDYFREFQCGREGKQFYVLEFLNDKPLEKRIIALNWTNNFKFNNQQCCSLNDFFVKPQYTNKNKKRNYRDIGAVLFGETVQRVLKSDADVFEFKASLSAKKFYFKILQEAHLSVEKIFNEGNDKFTIMRRNFQSIIDSIESKITFMI